MRYPGRLIEPPNRDKASMCWLLWDGIADVLGVVVDMCKSPVRPWGLADLRLISLYTTTGFRAQLVDPPRPPST